VQSISQVNHYQRTCYIKIDVNEYMETIIQVVKSYSVGKEPDSIVVVIPKKLGVKPGTEFCVKFDKQGRLIYEPIKKEK